MKNKKYLYNILMASVLTANVNAASASFVSLDATDTPSKSASLGNPEFAPNTMDLVGKQKVRTGPTLFLIGTLFDENFGKYSSEERSKIRAQKLEYQSQTLKKRKTLYHLIEDLEKMTEDLECIKLRSPYKHKIQQIDNRIDLLIMRLEDESKHDIGKMEHYCTEIDNLNNEIKALDITQPNTMNTVKIQESDVDEAVELTPISTAKTSIGYSPAPDKLNLKSLINSLQQGFSKISTEFFKITKRFSGFKEMGHTLSNIFKAKTKGKSY